MTLHIQTANVLELIASLGDPPLETMTPVEARAMFTAAVDRLVEQLPDAEAGLERTRLLGSSAAAGPT